MTNSDAPPPGFYDDPQHPGKQRWWDGTQWTDVSRDAERDDPNIAEQLIGAVQGRLPDAQTAVGGALIADGIVGFGRNREGIFGALKGLIVGIVLVVVFAFFVAPWMSEQSAIAEPVPTTATVVAIERVESTTTDDRGRTVSAGSTCSVTLAYTTADGQPVEASTPYSADSLCSFTRDQQVEIEYDATMPGRFQGLDGTGETIMRWFPWLFVGAGILLLLSSLWTLVLRATQIGGGLYLVNRSRQRDRERWAKKHPGPSAERG